MRVDVLTPPRPPKPASFLTPDEVIIHVAAPHPDSWGRAPYIAYQLADGERVALWGGVVGTLDNGDPELYAARAVQAGRPVRVLWHDTTGRVVRVDTNPPAFCDTCPTPEVDWPADDPLHLPGSTQCGPCRRRDINRDTHARRADR